MFEKEATKYAIYYPKVEKGEILTSKDLQEAYITGAKAHSVKWHDLRKDSNDLPKEDGWYEVSVYSKIKGTRKSGLYTKRAFYSLDRREWQTNCCDFCQRDDWVNTMIRAWTELPKFEEKGVKE